jgi:regulatory protein
MTDLERCYLAALRILHHRFNSTAELRRKLKSKKFETEVIDEAVTRLRNEKWLDDSRFASAFVRTRQNKKIGSRRIARELTAAGVNDETARLAIRENADPEREREDLLALVAKRCRMLARRHGDEYVVSPEGRNKLAAYLLKQGYDAALVSDALKQWSAADLGGDT